MPSYRILGNDFGPEGWTLCGAYADEAEARLAARDITLFWRVVAVVCLVGHEDSPVVQVISANVPRPKALVHAHGFRKVATAL